MMPVTAVLTSPTAGEGDGCGRENKEIHGVPHGRRWNASVVGTRSGPIGTTIVWPALFPPANRAQISTSADSMSTSLPLPSSPHCDPRTTVTVPPGSDSVRGPQSKKLMWLTTTHADTSVADCTRFQRVEIGTGEGRRSTIAGTCWQQADTELSRFSLPPSQVARSFF